MAPPTAHDIKRKVADMCANWKLTTIMPGCIRPDLPGFETSVEGFGINEPVDAKGNTALHVAAECGCMQVVTYLVKAGASTALPGEDGHAAIAVAALHGNWAVVEYLALHSDTPTVFDALVVACKGATLHIVQVLAETLGKRRVDSFTDQAEGQCMAAITNALEGSGSVCVYVLTLIMNNLYFAKLADEGGLPFPQAALFVAIAARNGAAVLLFIDFNADVFQLKLGKTVLVAAMEAFNQHTGQRREIVGAILDRILRDEKAKAFENLATLTEDGAKSALSVAAHHGDLWTVEAIIGAGGHRLVRRCDVYCGEAGHLIRQLAATISSPSGTHSCGTPFDAVPIMLKLVIAGAAIIPCSLHHTFSTAFALARATGKLEFAGLIDRLGELQMTPIMVALTTGFGDFLKVLLSGNLIPIDPKRDNTASLVTAARATMDDVLAKTVADSPWYAARIVPSGVQEWPNSRVAATDELCELAGKISYVWTRKTHTLSPSRVVVETVMTCRVKSGSILAQLPEECMDCIFSFLVREVVSSN